MTSAFFTAPELSKVELSLHTSGNPPTKIHSAVESSVGVYQTFPSDSTLNKFLGQLLGDCAVWGAASSNKPAIYFLL